MEHPIRNITDTALWVAVYRADETDQKDALFKDPYARKLAGERGEQIVRAMEEGRRNSWSFIARTYLFDKCILEHTNAGFEQVLNLASGLDTRPYRLPLPQHINWIDVDLPEIVEYINEEMKNENPVCNHKRISLDLSNSEKRKKLFNEMERNSKKTLIVSEGLMGYLSEKANEELAADLSSVSSFERWVLDLMSPGILPLINNEMNSLLENANAPLIFAPDEGERFYEKFGWKHIESASKLKTAAQLNRLSDEMLYYASLPEPNGHRGNFPWSGVCLFGNIKRNG